MGFHCIDFSSSDKWLSLMLGCEEDLKLICTNLFWGHSHLEMCYINQTSCFW